MTVNQWLPNPGTRNPVRKGETLTGLRFRNGSERVNGISGAKWSWSEEGQYTITHYRVTPPRTAAPIAEPAAMSADEVLIRAREAAIEVWGSDELNTIQAILVYERDRAKPLAEVAPHTVEDADERSAYDVCMEKGGLFTWEERHSVPHYRAILAAIKRGRELEHDNG